MLVLTTKIDVRQYLQTPRRLGETIALVPTMGYLHEGHLSLVRMAKQKAACVIVSIFVNPIQFAPNEDLESYPRNIERDLTLLRDLGVDAVFMPAADEMYGAGGGTFVDVPELSNILQGSVRPEHFRGVATVVTKLFNITCPDIAIFGEKDYQQLTLIRRMSADLDMDIEILGHPTVREADGLAMSSRNVRLLPKERQAAVVINQALNQAQAFAEAQEALTASSLLTLVHEILAQEPLASVVSVDLRDAETLAPLSEAVEVTAVILIAVRFGNVLLIDQRVIPSKGLLPTAVL